MKKKHGLFVILPYNMLSEGASLLATKLNCLRVREDGQFKPKKPYIIINWGNPRDPQWWEGRREAAETGFLGKGGKILNHWAWVKDAINKKTSLEKMSAGRVCIPEYTTSIDVARSWMNSDKNLKVVCRQLLRASGGKGIVVATKAEELVEAPLYTKFFVKDKEYRVHVFKNDVIDVQQKKLKAGATKDENHNKYIRNHANGWVFCRDNVEVPARAQEEAIAAIKSLNLDFGAVDVAVSKDGIPCVFEVNTAPGLEGTTIDKYTEAFLTLR